MYLSSSLKKLSVFLRQWDLPLFVKEARTSNYVMSTVEELPCRCIKGEISHPVYFVK